MDNSYSEYVEQMKAVEVSNQLQYSLAFLWHNASRLPLGLVSIGDCNSNIIKIPPKVKNGYGNIVPVVAISNMAFRDKAGITDIILPSSITKLPAKAFANCTGLKNVTIPRSIKKIKEGTFEGCKNLQNIYYEGSLEEWERIEIVHQKYEIEFGSPIPGRPVDSIKAERLKHIPGNDAIYSANVYFNCNLDEIMDDSYDPENIKCRDLYYEKWHQNRSDIHIDA